MIYDDCQLLQYSLFKSPYIIVTLQILLFLKKFALQIEVRIAVFDFYELRSKFATANIASQALLSNAYCFILLYFSFSKE